MCHFWKNSKLKGDPSIPFQPLLGKRRNSSFIKYEMYRKCRDSSFSHHEDFSLFCHSISSVDQLSNNTILNHPVSSYFLTYKQITFLQAIQFFLICGLWIYLLSSRSSVFLKPRWSPDTLLLSWSFQPLLSVDFPTTYSSPGHFSTRFFLLNKVVQECLGILAARCASCIWSHPRGAFLCNRNIIE